MPITNCGSYVNRDHSTPNPMSLHVYLVFDPPPDGVEQRYGGEITSYEGLRTRAV